jgi:hypothetical protein
MMWIRHESKRFKSNDDRMGVMPRKLGDDFIITSDRIPGELPSGRTPKRLSGCKLRLRDYHPRASLSPLARRALALGFPA